MIDDITDMRHPVYTERGTDQHGSCLFNPIRSSKYCGWRMWLTDEFTTSGMSEILMGKERDNDDDV